MDISKMSIKEMNELSEKIDAEKIKREDKKDADLTNFLLDMDDIGFTAMVEDGYVRVDDLFELVNDYKKLLTE